MAALRKLLVTYGEGHEGEAALKEGLGVDIDTLQAGFDTLLNAKYGPDREGDDAAEGARVRHGEIESGGGGESRTAIPAQVALGEFLWKAGRIDEAFRVLERAAQLVPMAAGPQEPARDDGADGDGAKRSRARHQRAGSVLEDLAHRSGFGAAAGEAARAGRRHRRARS